MRVRIVGRGRAGRSFEHALGRVGVDVEAQQGSGDAVIEADDVDLVLLAVPDDAIARASRRVRRGRAVVAHCAGSRGLDLLGDHRRVGSVHPLMSLPDGDTGGARLLDRCTFAVAGDPLCHELVARLGGRAIEVPDEIRATYHAAACVAANHLVVVAAQVERLAAEIGVPVDAYWRLMRTTLANVERIGAVPALTGPAARGDATTIAAHLAALPPDERPLYGELARAAGDLAVRDGPSTV